jgi:membrane-associated protease RseP (regulator of RpoE activity)
MNDSTSPQAAPAVLTEIPRHSTTGVPAGALSATRTRIPGVNLILFGLTLLTTTMAGAYMAGATLPWSEPATALMELRKGLSFSLPALAILLSHEMGHYVFARRNGVDVSLPYFIPAPLPSFFFFGTFGAFIRMRTQPRTRRVMFDVGAAGPWFGVIIAIPAVIVGLMLSNVQPLDRAAGGLNLGDSILFWGLARFVLGVDPNSVSVILHPIALAGWLGLFVTTLNLLPVGQLDGGHVTYALLGSRWHRFISRALIIGCVGLAIVPALLGRDFWGGWMLWAVLLLMLGIGHPATIDADTPLDKRRRVAAWLTVALFVATFTPIPISLALPQEPPDESTGQTYDVRFDAPSVPPAPPSPRELTGDRRVALSGPG